MNSFLINLKTVDVVEFFNIPEIFYKTFKNILKSEDFTITSLLSNNKEKIELQANKNYYIRITTLRKEVYSNIIALLYRYKVTKLPFQIGKVGFIINSLILDNAKSKWCKDFNYFKENNILGDEISLSFASPLVFKVGETFITDFDLEYFFWDLQKKYKKYFDDIKGNILGSIDKIQLKNICEKKKIICINKYKILGTIHKFTLNISNLQEEEKEKIKKLLTFGFFIGVGYKNNLGYGQYLIII